MTFPLRLQKWKMKMKSLFKSNIEVKRESWTLYVCHAVLLLYRARLWNDSTGNKVHSTSFAGTQNVEVKSQIHKG